MQDRFKFRAIVKGYYYIDTPEEYEEFEPLIFLEDVDVLSNGEIGIMEDRLEVAIREQHPNVDTVDIGYMLENFRENSCGIDNYVTITPEVIYQSTGLKDKNGKLIFEGDVIKIPNDYDTYGMFACEKREIYFNEGGFRLKPKWDKNSRGNWLEDTKDFEIIGNIYNDNLNQESE